MYCSNAPLGYLSASYSRRSTSLFGFLLASDDHLGDDALNSQA